jgi:hypothetical protein
MSEPAVDPLPLVLVSLMKGVVEREANPTTWSSLVEHQPRARDYFALVGLDLLVNETDGLAYLRQRVQSQPITDTLKTTTLTASKSVITTVWKGSAAIV